MHVTFCTQKYYFDKITAILTLTGDGTMGKDWLRARGITCVLQTQFSNFFFFFFGGGGGQGNMAIYFKGTLESNSLFLGNKINVRECLKIILWNKADHKKIFVCCIPSYPPIFPLSNTFYGTSWK